MAFSADSPASAASTSSTLEGVVAYLGPTDFAGGDWVGVRLTGTSSRGRGRNDGRVKGKRYFVCDEKCGMFVRRSAISKRTLTRIEELRLRREIGSTLLASSSPVPPGDGARYRQNLTDNEEKQQMMTTPTREQPSSLQRALSSSKRGEGGIRKREIGNPSHVKTPPPHQSNAAASAIGTDRRQSGESTNANGSTRKSRLDQIRERKAALAASATKRDTTASHSPLTTTASSTAAETLSGGTFSAEEETNRLAGELSALRGELFALRDENASLRNALVLKNAEALTSVSGSGMAAQHTNQPALPIGRAKSTCEDNDSACLDSLEELLDDGSTHDASAGQQVISKPLPAQPTRKIHSPGFANSSLLDEIETPAKPDLERRLAKALLKIALLSEELEDLRESKQSGDERTLRDQGEEFLIRISLEEIRKCPDIRFLPTSLPLALQGVIAASDWPSFARETEDEIYRWANTQRRIPWNATFGTIAASTSLVLLYFSLFGPAVLSIFLATPFLAASCHNACLSRTCRRKLEVLFKEYGEKWPGSVIQLSKEQGPRRRCGACSPCSCTHYLLRIASDFDIERSQVNITHTDRERGGGDTRNGSKLPPRSSDLEEPLLPFVSTCTGSTGSRNS